MTEKQDVETNTRERPPESMVLHWRRLGSPTHLAQVSGLPEKTQTARERTREPLIMHSKGALPRLRLRQTVGDSSTPLPTAAAVGQVGRPPACHLSGDPSTSRGRMAHSMSGSLRSIPCPLH